MNAHAHLLSLGWAGPGYALDSRPPAYKQAGKQGLDYNPKKITNTGAGLVKPLMISHRRDRSGIGKKDPKHEPAAGNEWWLKGFETALGNIGKSDGERSGTATSIQMQAYGMKHQGLYGFFVKGQQMEGTIGHDLLKKSKKRKSDRISGNTSSDDEKEAPKPKGTIEDFAQAALFMAVRDKDEKRWKRTEKAGALEEFQQATEYFEARSNKKKHKSELEVEGAEVENAVDIGGPVRKEEKEERRERRRKRRQEKAAKKAPEAEENKSSSAVTQDDTSKRKSKDELRKPREHI